MLGVVRAHFDEVAIVAGHVVHLEDFRELGQRLSDAILGAGLVAANGPNDPESAFSKTNASRAPSRMRTNVFSLAATVR